jgi:hypothetical protein
LFPVFDFSYLPCLSFPWPRFTLRYYWTNATVPKVSHFPHFHWI